MNSLSLIAALRHQHATPSFLFKVACLIQDERRLGSDERPRRTRSRLMSTHTQGNAQHKQSCLNCILRAMINEFRHIPTELLSRPIQMNENLTHARHNQPNKALTVSSFPAFRHLSTEPNIYYPFLAYSTNTPPRSPSTTAKSFSSSDELGVPVCCVRFFQLGEDAKRRIFSTMTSTPNARKRK